jgi:hypothetical protein
VALGIAIMLSQVLTIPQHTRQGTTPRAVLADDRLLAVARGLLIGSAQSALAASVMLYYGTKAASAIAHGTTAPAIVHATTASAIVLAAGLALIGFYAGASGTAWCQFLFVRTRLAADGLLPWRVMDFLEDAQRWGILRPVGGCYEFRYQSMQKRLVTLYPMATDPSSPTQHGRPLADAASIQ